MKLLVLPGDGIGPEIVDAAVNVLRAADARFGLGLHFDYEDVGFASLEKHGTTLRDETLQKARGYDGIILGTQSHADYPKPEKGGHNISAAFRVKLDLSGSLGLAGSMLAGDQLCCAQAQHGSAPDIQGQDKANPVSMILSVSMLLGWLAERRSNGALARAAKAIDAAVDATLENPSRRTADLGGTVGCKAFGELVARAL